MRNRTILATLFARAIKATALIDRGYRKFNHLRSKLVLGCGSDEFFRAYNDLAYSGKRSYCWAKEGLTSYEEQAISRFFPGPPSSLLIGAAGSGREALALARYGYRVVAFDPISSMVAALAESSNGLPIDSFIGRYEDLPFVSTLAMPSVSVDLRSRAPFSAAILAPWSISYLRSDDLCIKMLRQIRELTMGPILLSYAPSSVGSNQYFGINEGYYRTFKSTELHALVEKSGLDILYLDEQSRPHWHAVLARSK